MNSNPSIKNSGEKSSQPENLLKIVSAKSKLLDLLGREISKKEYLDEVVRLIRTWTGARYAGVRVLDEEGQIPYGSYVGFDKEFWESENWLSTKRDQCACIRVVTGKPEPQDKTAMTCFGSFSLGNTLDFLDGLTSKQKERFRGACVRRGFLSLAIIPIRYNKKILGAVHIADERKNRFSSETVGFLEEMTSLIGAAINKFSYQEKIRENEEKYRELVENANSIILRLDAKGRITFFNEFSQKFFGFSEKEILGKRAVDTIIPKKDTSGEDLEKMMREIYRHPDQYTRNENENVCKNGKKVWVAWYNRPIFGKDRKLKGLLCVGNDITEKKKAREAMAKANRALKMLSQCNHTLIHVEKEKELLDSICKIIVETGGYRMAWVGNAENDEYRSVRAVAQRGFEDGYLKTANVSWSEKTIKGQGPTGTSIRLKKTIIGKDFLKDRKLLPWREQALKRGYRSSIALPLKSGSEVFGALMIYSSENNSFDREEVRLLEELAADLSFGVSTIRMREKQKRSEEQLVESYKHLGTVNRKISLLLEMEAHGKKRKKKEISNYILSSATSLSKADVGLVYVLDEKKCFRLLSSEGISKESRKKLEKITAKDCGIIQNLTKEKLSLRGKSKEYSLGYLNLFKKPAYFLALPLRMGRKTGGFIFLGFYDRLGMESYELEFYEVFSVHASSALANAGILKSG